MQAGEKVPITGSYAWGVRAMALSAIKPDGGAYAVWMPSRGIIASLRRNVLVAAYVGGILRSMLDTMDSEYLIRKEGGELLLVYNGRIRTSEIHRKMDGRKGKPSSGWDVSGIQQKAIAHDIRIMTKGKVTIGTAGRLLPKGCDGRWESLLIYADRLELVSPYLSAVLYPIDRGWKGKEGDTRPGYVPFGVLGERNSLRL